MSYDDELQDRSYYHRVLCNLCGKKFSFYTEEQEPGFRMLDVLHCPYCNAELDRSMEVEYNDVRKLED